MNVSITYCPTTLEDFQAAVAWMRETSPAAPVAVAIRPPAIKGGAEPNVEAYLAQTGDKHFKRTGDEIKAGLSPDQAARLRLEAMASGDGATTNELPSEPPPPHDGTPLF